MTLVDAAVYIDGRRVASGSAAETLAEARARGGMACIGLYRPEPDELDELASLLDLHPLAVEDALKGHQRAKLERYGEMTFLVLQPARYLDATETVEFGEVHVFVGPDYVITVRHAENPDLGAVRHRLEARPDVLAHGPSRSSGPCAMTSSTSTSRSLQASRTTSMRSRTSCSRAIRPCPGASSACSGR